MRARVISRPSLTGARDRSSGQSIVELTLILPVFLLMLLSMIDFGFAFYSNLTIEYASREGARVGAALANGGGPLGCGAGQSPNAATVDQYVIAAVERVLKSAGIQVDVNPSGSGGVQSIRIFKANATTGADSLGIGNVWTYSRGGGPLIPGTSTRLDFVETAHGWNVCDRVNTYTAPDSLGVAVSYRYAYITPLAGAFALATNGPAPALSFTDRTVMQLNPTGQ